MHTAKYIKHINTLLAFQIVDQLYSCLVLGAIDPDDDHVSILAARKFGVYNLAMAYLAPVMLFLLVIG